jgi:hypothetical protein
MVLECPRSGNGSKACPGSMTHSALKRFEPDEETSSVIVDG